jgi:hypothetical protein
LFVEDVGLLPYQRLAALLQLLLQGHKLFFSHHTITVVVGALLRRQRYKQTTTATMGILSNAYTFYNNHGLSGTGIQKSKFHPDLGFLCLL